ncbi:MULTISPECIES: hypothetical protein [Pseudomonas syringae group]|uniref:hypothetical protein n=1 Tax=Pseudomonas syringae group TaxID=136849 RepID=UPI0002910182|nr:MULTISPECIES: hypothetical protein [Pseudomonas syringae group]EKN43922.1 hypothetical protein AAI_24314 [Pseudomonas viridiflava UASWS0038]KPL66436.1 hypothetical protein PVFL_01780 [Pseudomonas viridiflava]MDY0917788.1 hypothetical protein [Pseudomonas viridiflava]MEE3922889.1 hypothetical protein [Pseudomonas viridiflava]MEE3929117.1 hypothetical protein [Pseudomonas viridiflava]
MKDHRRLAHYVAFGLLLCAATHAQASPPPPLSVTLGQKHLQLIDHQGRCALSEPDQSLRVLEMAWPCQFGPDKHGNARVEMFNNTPIVLVMRNEREPAPGTNCLAQTQALRLIKGKLEASVRMDTAGCGYGADQKVYVGLFDW